MKILVCSDIHGNVHAQERVIKSEQFDKSIFLGDIVDYGPKPSEAIDLIRDNFDTVVQGNHDYAAATGRDCMCSQENHDLSVYTREKITMQTVGKNDMAYLASLPKSKRIEIGGRTFEINHGSPENRLFGYLYPSRVSGSSLTDENGKRTDSDYLLVGHTHHQFAIPMEGMMIINPGSIGQPRDGFPDPSYAIIDTDNWSISLKRVKFDRDLLKREIISSLPEGAMLDRNLRLFGYR